MKQLTPHNQVLVTAVISAFLQTVFLYAILIWFTILLPVWLWLVIFIGFFVTIYLVFYYVLQAFIYKKVKLIYKSIRTVKGQDTIQKKSLNLLNQVEDEVADWHKRQQKEIAQLKKMEKFRKEYIGNVSHELKTPLFNIQGYLETLTSIDDKNSEVFQTFLDKALQNTERLQTIVEDLDMISKIETENLTLNLTAFSIKDLISEVYKEMEFLTKKAYVSLNFKPNKCPDFTVVADKDRIRQVVVNLVTNAIKYNKPDGKVIASCYDLDDDHILIEFTDTGIGIKQKHLPRLFERFYRVDKNRSRKKGGSGLGLAIVKHIIENHQQTVHVRSTPNVGTTFGFTLKKYKEQYKIPLL
ncbi:MAG TPA: sensor histidine kinase [Flavobacteriales bacterium]|jgi:two-component system phosphate regulon sensor histidine kinase PhoR|nr:sensor histidine kinase [Flavobacteriales bacterium]